MQIYRLSITIGNNNCFFSIKKNSAQSKFPKLNYHAECLINPLTDYHSINLPRALRSSVLFEEISDGPWQYNGVQKY